MRSLPRQVGHGPKVARPSSTNCPEFTRLGQRHDVPAAPMLTRTFRHPIVGNVTLDCDSLTLTDRDQHLVIYTAPQGCHDAEALALLNVLGAETSTTRRSL